MIHFVVPLTIIIIIIIITIIIKLFILKTNQIE